jgi:alpha-tubulin suppressor-like RCC1 family protein
LFIFGCNQGNKNNNGTVDDGQGPIEPGKPVSLAKVVSVSLGIYHACAVDDKNHVACWNHPQKFIPSSLGSKKGSFEIDYPSKTNADLAGQKFSYIASLEKNVCAVRADGKVICFFP